MSTLGAVAGVMLVLGCISAGGATWNGSVASRTGSQLATPDVRIRLLSQTPTVGSTNRFFMRALIDGSQDLADRGDIEVATTLYQRLRTRAGFTSSLRRERLGSPLKVVVTSLGDASPDASVTTETTFDIGACATCITLASDGVYPVVVEVRRRGGAEVLADMVTYLIRASALQVDHPLAVALAVPLHLAPATKPDGSTTDTDISGFVSVAESLGSHPDVALTLIPTPESIDALSRSDAGDGGALDTLRTALSGREVVAGPYVDLLPQALSDTRLAAEVVAQLDEGNATLSRHLGVELSTGILARLGADPLPDSSTLARLRINRLIINSSQITVSGVSQTPFTFDRQVIFDPGAGDNSEANALPAVVADPALAAHLDNAADQLLGTNHLLADLSIIAQQGGADRGVVVALPAAGLARTSLDLLLSTLAAQPQLHAVTVSSLFSLPGALDDDGQRLSVQARTTAQVKALTSEEVARIDRLRSQIDGVASMYDDPPAQLSQSRRVLSVSLARNLPPSTPRTAYLNQLDDSLPAMLSQVHLGAVGSFRLTALRGKIPLTVINDTGRPVKVRVRVSSDRLRFPQLTGPLELTIKARTDTERIDVASRSSGTFSLIVGLTTPSGLLLASDRYTVRSTGVSGVGVGLSIGALGILATWWARTTVRRRRHSAKANRSPHDNRDL